MPRKKIVIQPNIEETSMPDSYSEHRIVDNSYMKPEPMEASIPLDGLREETRGFQPRSREPFTRESDARADRFISYYEQTVSEAHKGKTHMPEELIPEGYVFMWARESCKGRPDHGNLSELETRHGWEYATASQFPTKAYYDDQGNVEDSSSRVRCGGLIGMIRKKSIHEAQMKQFARLRNNQSRTQQQLRSRDGDLHPFSNQTGFNNNNRFFPSDEVSRSFASTF